MKMGATDQPVHSALFSPETRHFSLVKAVRLYGQHNNIISLKSMMNNVKRKVDVFSVSKTAAYIREFGQATTLHGIPYIIKKNYHYTETFLWLLTVCLATYGAAKLIYDSWDRYNLNPTVVSLEKDFREWNLTFPAATVCFLDRTNETKAAEYIAETWKVEQNTTEFEKYSKFVNAVTNMTYDNFDDFNEFKGMKEFSSMTGEQLAAIARENMVKMEYHASIFDVAYSYIAFRESLTEMGICHTFSGVASNYYSLRKGPVVTQGLPNCNYLTSICYGRVEDLPRPIRYYIHSPYELPAASDVYYDVHDSMERDTSWRYTEMVSASQLRRLEPRQRQCRFFDEPLEGDQVYSYNICKMGCRKKMAYRLCGCAPYFYIKSGDIPICGVEGLACLSQFTDNIVKLTNKDGSSVDCKCLSQCEFITFYIEEDHKRTWAYPVPPNIRFRWAIQHYSKTRQKRDIIFGFEDLLVSLGGTAALFLGCSVLSFVEVGYFFSLRLFWHLVKIFCGAKKANGARSRRSTIKRVY